MYATLDSGLKISKQHSFRTPWVDSSEAFPVCLSYSYYSRFDEKFAHVLNKTVTVNGISFTPPFDVNLLDYYWNKSDTHMNLTAMFLYNKTLDEAFEKAVMDLSIGTKNALIPLEIEENQTTLMKEMVLDNNESFDRIRAKFSYEKGPDTYYFHRNFAVKTPNAPKSAAEVHKDPVNKTDPLEYLNRPKIKNVTYSPLDPTMIIVAAIIILSIFFIIIMVFAFKKKSKSNVPRMKKWHDFSAEGTEKLVDTPQETQPVEAETVLESAPDPTTDLTVIESYVEAQLAKGKSKEVIRNELLARGWLEDIVEVYLK
jgi:hypothetical protein